MTLIGVFIAYAAIISAAIKRLFSKIHAKTPAYFGASKIPGVPFFFIAKATAA